MVLRKLTLSEWFLRYQLLKFQKHHFYLPIELDVDITAFELFFNQRGLRAPVTAVMVKAAAMLQRRIPYSHRVLFPTLFGPRLLQMTEPIVNLPILIPNEHEKYRAMEPQVLSAIAIQQADQKTLKDISQEIKAALARPLSSYPIVNFISGHQNNFLNRLLLRSLYFMAYCMPKNYMKRKAGGICVSSLYNNHQNDFQLRPYAFGPTALTLCFSSVESKENKRILKVGVGYDHTAFSGNEMSTAIQELSHLLQDVLTQTLESESELWPAKASEIPFGKPIKSGDKYF